MRPREKLDALAEMIGLKIDYGKRPWQVMKDLFTLRNDIAHGKTELLTNTELMSLPKYNNTFPSLIPVRWEKLCNLKDTERTRQDVEQMILTLYESANLEGERAFPPGYQSGTDILDEE
jgi:hypothetical protein